MRDFFFSYDVTPRPNNLPRQYAHQFLVNFRVGILWTAIALLAILIIAGITIKLTKPQLLKKFLIGWFIAFLAYAVVVIILGLVGNMLYMASVADRDDSTAGWLVIFLWVFFGLAIFTAIGLYLAVHSNKDKFRHTETLAITHAAVAIALSFALSYTRIFRLPQGGSITLAAFLPLAIYSYVFGIKRGLAAAFIFGILRAIHDPWILHPIQFLLDYPIAITFIGFAGIFKNVHKLLGREKRITPMITLPLGIFISMIGTFFSRTLAGGFFFYDWAWDGWSPWAYAFAYNSITVFPEMAITMAAAVLIMLSRQMRVLILQTENKFKKIIANKPDGDNIDDRQEELTGQTFDTPMTSDADALQNSDAR